jgi:hypothetical protein
MPSSRDDLVVELKYVMGQRDDLDARYPDWIRRAYDHLTQSVEFPEAEEEATTTTVIGQRIYPLPSDFFSMYSVRNDANDTRMFQVGISEYDGLLASATGSPDRYAVFKEQLYIHPTPDAIINLGSRYRRIMPDLALGTSVHLLPAAWDQPIIQLAAAFGFDYTNEIERSAYYRRIVSQFVRGQRQRIASNLFDRNEPLAPIGGSIN